MGYFKDEGRISQFRAFAPKIYAYYPAKEYIWQYFSPSPVLKCAGAKADEIIKYFYNYCESYPQGYIGNLIEFLDIAPTFPITTLHRTNTGAEYRTEWRTLTHYGDFDEERGEL